MRSFSFLLDLQSDQNVFYAASSGRMLICAYRFVCGGMSVNDSFVILLPGFFGVPSMHEGRAVTVDLLTCPCPTLLLISKGTEQKLLFTLYKCTSSFQLEFNSSLCLLVSKKSAF